MISHWGNTVAPANRIVIRHSCINKHHALLRSHTREFIIISVEVVVWLATCGCTQLCGCTLLKVQCFSRFRFSRFLFLVLADSGLAEYGLSDSGLAVSCTAYSDLTVPGLARYAPPKNFPLLLVSPQKQGNKGQQKTILAMKSVEPSI